MTTTSREIVHRIRDAGLRPPESLTLMVTKGCNLYCRHCWLDCIPAASSLTVPAPVLMKWIHEFIGMGGKRIFLAGGEPLSHPDWFHMLESCCGSEDLEQVCLQTNGTLLTSEVVSALRELPIDKLVIQVSLDGAESATHDYVRGSGNFTRTLRGIHLLVNAGMGRQIRLAFTEMTHNFKDLPVLMEMAETLGIGRLIGNTLVKGGRAYRNKSFDLPLPSQYRELIGRYQTDRRFRDIYRKRGSIAAIEWFKGRPTSAKKVCTCIQNIIITSDGTLYPCVMFMHPQYGVSQLDKRTLQEAITEALPQWKRLPKISERRSRELKLCKTCPGQKHCAGGCMGRAYAVYGELMEVEDRCALRRTVYSWKKPSKARTGRNQK